MIRSLQLKNFKRFTDLTLKDIPNDARLVLLIGSNGSGKSSVFDGFEVLNKYRHSKFSENDTYYSKGRTYHIIADFGDGFISDTKKHVLAGNNFKIPTIDYYGRTSFRQIPRLTRTQLGTKFNVQSDDDRPQYFIDRDERFENDLEHLFGKLLKEFFKSDDEKSEIKETVIAPINAAFERIFFKENGTKLELIELIPPLEGKSAEINFRKGKSVFHYNQLSAGEKEIFNILVNLIARREYHTQTVYFFDEIDLHLNTNLQYNFLKEITENWIPENCQLWTASHSLGFIQYAKDYPNAVVFDFDDYDFDYTRVLTPEPKDKADIYEIAVSKEILPHLFRNFNIVFVENEDRKYYASLNIDTILFVSEKNRDAVFHKSKTGQFSGLVDRDFLTDNDIDIIEAAYPNLKILRFYCVENYLFHPDNLAEYYQRESSPYSKEEYKRKIFEEKERVKPELLIKVASIRQAYPYFKEVEKEKSSYRKRFTPDQDNYDQTSTIAKYLDSDVFEEFYKSFSMKDFCKSIVERQNVAPVDLSKTNWFKSEIEKIIK